MEVEMDEEEMDLVEQGMRATVIEEEGERVRALRLQCHHSTPLVWPHLFITSRQTLFQASYQADSQHILGSYLKPFSLSSIAF